VKGWDGGKSWISTSTLLFRYNFTNYLLMARLTARTLRSTAMCTGQSGENRSRRAARETGKTGRPTLKATFPDIGLGTSRTQAFLAYLQTRAPDRGDETIRSLLHLIDEHAAISTHLNGA
jgi:hypothetical protein